MAYYTSFHPGTIASNLSKGNYRDLTRFEDLAAAVGSLKPGQGVYSQKEKALLNVWLYHRTGGIELEWR